LISNLSDLNPNEMVEKYKALRNQNKELKQLLIEKENEINTIKKDNINLRSEVSEIMDPISGKTLLKQVNQLS
jgi:cell shape-determining protein MreC